MIGPILHMDTHSGLSDKAQVCIMEVQLSNWIILVVMILLQSLHHRRMSSSDGSQ